VETIVFSEGIQHRLGSGGDTGRFGLIHESTIQLFGSLWRV
jgi:hypothetical protein